MDWYGDEQNEEVVPVKPAKTFLFGAVDNYWDVWDLDLNKKVSSTNNDYLFL